MFTIKVKGNIISVQETEPITSGSVSVYKCQFTFDNSWEGFFRSAVFRCGSMVKTVPLDAENMCDLPWELLEKKHIGLPVEVSIYGSKGETEILPTIWDKLGRVRKGSEPGDDVQRYSPSVYERIVSLIKAYSEKTKGDKGDKGDPGEGDMNAAVYDPRGKATDIFAYVNDSAASKIHASQHSAVGSDPITPAAIGAAPAGFGLGTKAVDISGKNITEIAFGGKWGLYRGINVIGCPYPDVWYTYEVFPSYGDGTQGYAGIVATNINNGNLYTCAVIGTTITAWKQLATTDTALMKTDKPSGSYTGNNDATRRTIHTGGIGGTAIIYSANGVAIVTAAGAFRYSFSSGMLGVGVRFENGELIIISDDDTVNASGITYTYQVL